jgi:hypothetical protein
MKKNRFGPIGLASVVLIFASLACNALQASTSTAIPMNTSTSLPTATASPMTILLPTETPDVSATQQASDLQTRIQGYVKNGYLTSNQGNFSNLQDATFDLAKMNYFNFQDAGYEDQTKNFAAWAHVKLSSASAVNYPEYSGCGFWFRLNDNGDGYAAMVAKDRVIVASCRNSSCREVGKTRGSGRLDYEGDFEANVELIVNDTDVHFLVEGKPIGEYTLSSDYLTDPGYFAYTQISGTNKDYGTRCEFSNAGLWIPQP